MWYNVWTIVCNIQDSNNSTELSLAKDQFTELGGYNFCHGCCGTSLQHSNTTLQHKINAFLQSAAIPAAAPRAAAAATAVSCQTFAPEAVIGSSTVHSVEVVPDTSMNTLIS